MWDGNIWIDEGQWYPTNEARAEWRGAPADDGVLRQLLEVARFQVLEYAPAMTSTLSIPVNYRQAQLMQARNIWNAFKADGGGQIGDDGFAIQPRPLDWVIKAIIRPKRGVPVVG